MVGGETPLLHIWTLSTSPFHPYKIKDPSELFTNTVDNIITCTGYKKIKFISQLLYSTRIITRNLRGTRRWVEVGRGKGLLPRRCGSWFCSVFHAVFPHSICNAISNGHHHPHQVRPGKHKTNTGKVDSRPMYNE